MADKKPPKGDKKPSNQLPLGSEPGVGRKAIPELDELATSYKNFRNRRQDLTKKEVESNDRLTDAMHKHEKELGRAPDGSLTYVYEDEDSPTGLSCVKVQPTDEKTKVLTYKDPGEPE